MWPKPPHLRFRFSTKVRSLSYFLVTAWIFLQASSKVIWSLHEMFNNSRLHLISKTCVLFSNSAVKVHDSQAYRNIDKTRERISFIFDPRDMLLFLHIGPHFVRAGVACAVLERTSVLSLHLKTCLKGTEACHCSKLLSFILALPLVVVGAVYHYFVFSALISILYLVQVLSRRSSRASLA